MEYRSNHYYSYSSTKKTLSLGKEDSLYLWNILNKLVSADSRVEEIEIEPALGVRWSSGHSGQTGGFPRCTLGFLPHNLKHLCQ